jgi:hypothetical protein
MVVWLHITAFSTFPFPFLRTGEGDFYQQHHQHRRFFHHGKQQHFNSAEGRRRRRRVFFLRFTRPDITRYPRCFVSFFSAYFFSLSLSFCFSSSFLATINKTQTHKHTQKYITQKLQEKTVCRFMLFLPSNQSLTSLLCIFTFKPIFDLSLVYFWQCEDSKLDM